MRGLSAALDKYLLPVAGGMVAVLVVACAALWLNADALQDQLGDCRASATLSKGVSDAVDEVDRLDEPAVDEWLRLRSFREK